MTAIDRVSPLRPSYTQDDLKAAIETLENRPRIPEKTPSSSSVDGYEGEICADGSYVYFYRNGSWKRASLSSF